MQTVLKVSFTFSFHLHLPHINFEFISFFQNCFLFLQQEIIEDFCVTKIKCVFVVSWSFYKRFSASFLMFLIYLFICLQFFNWDFTPHTAPTINNNLSLIAQETEIKKATVKHLYWQFLHFWTFFFLFFTILNNIPKSSLFPHYTP